jgi:hypothetical protein
MKPLLSVNWCGHSQQFIPWPEADGYWRLVPVMDGFAGRLESLKA